MRLTITAINIDVTSMVQLAQTLFYKFSSKFSIKEPLVVSHPHKKIYNGKRTF